MFKRKRLMEGVRYANNSGEPLMHVTSSKTPPTKAERMRDLIGSDNESGKTLKRSTKSTTPPTKAERKQDYIGDYPTEKPGDAQTSLRNAKMNLSKKEFKKVAKEVKKRHNMELKGSKVESFTRSSLNLVKCRARLTETDLDIDSVFLNNRKFAKLAKGDKEPRSNPNKVNNEEGLAMSLYDRIIDEGDYAELGGKRKMSGKAGRYAALKAKRKSGLLGKGEDKKMGADDAGAKMSKWDEGLEEMDVDMEMDSDDSDDEDEKKSKGGSMKAKMAALRAMRGKGKAKKAKKDDEDEDEDEMEESYDYDDDLEEAAADTKQSSGDSDDFFAWSQKRKPKSMKVRPRGSTWDYNPVPVKPDADHGKVKISKYRKEDGDMLDSVAEIAESIRSLRDTLLG